MRTSAPRQCAPGPARNRWRGNVLRRGGHAGPCRASGTGRDRSDPPVRGPGTGSGPGVLAHPPPPSPSGRSRTSNPSRKGIARRFEAAEEPLADCLAVGLFGLAAQDRDAPRHGSPWPSHGSPWPSRMGLLDGSDPAAPGKMGLSGPILPGADRRMPRWGVAPSHVRGARVGIDAPSNVAQRQQHQRLIRSKSCPVERRFRVRRRSK